MSEFRVPVVRVRAIEPIPGADLIELAVVGDYRSVIKRGQFRPGDLVTYIPEGALVPPDLLQRIGLEGKLAGPEKNRVKAIRLRGTLSQGILVEPEGAVAEGDDRAAALGIVKYEPPVPASMAGEVANLFGYTVRYDIENIKMFHDVLEDGEPVEITEKIHGSFCCAAVVPGLDHPEMFGGDGLVMSKGLGAKGLVFKDNAANAGNIYVQAVRALDLHTKIRALPEADPIHVFGEIYGRGVQDLHYGRTDRAFALFDVYVGAPGSGRFLDSDAKAAVAAALGVPRVPVLFRGPFSRAGLAALTDGRTTVGGAHLREGVVVTPVTERRHPELGRVILKSVSGDFLTRKGGTEYA